MIFFTIIGVLFLYAGAECLIRGGASFAIRIGLPILVVSLVVIGYGTGTPELVVSLEASLNGNGSIALGNVLGSNIANTGLILGFAALCRPISVKRQLVQYDAPVMVIVSLIACLLLSQSHEIGRLKSIPLLIGLIVYTLWTIYLGKREKKVELEIEETFPPHLLKSVWLDFIFIISGFALLILGSHLFLDGAIALAKFFNISDAVIGLTIVAFGTSLPEFATSIVAIIKKHEDVALGNIIGSNIFNILAIIGVAAFASPLNVEGIHWIDYAYMTTLALFVFVIIRRKSQISRGNGAALLLSYAAYMTYLFT